MKTLILISLIFLSACANQKAIDAKAKHEAETSSRINDAGRNVDSLFDEIE